VVFAEPVDATAEVYGLTDDHCADAELADKATAIPARGKRRNHDLVAVSALAAGLSKGVGFPVNRGIAFLDSAIVATAEEFSFAIEEGRADGDAAFGETEAGIVQSDF